MRITLQRTDGVWYIEVGEYGFAYSRWLLVGLTRAVRRAILDRKGDK